MLYANNSEEIKGIYNLEDYQKIQPEGKYIVLNDIMIKDKVFA